MWKINLELTKGDLKETATLHPTQDKQKMRGLQHWIKANVISCLANNTRISNGLHHQDISGMKLITTGLENDLLLFRSIDDLGLGPKVIQALKQAGIFYNFDLVSRSQDDILGIYGIWPKALWRIEKSLSSRGLLIGTLLPPAIIETIKQKMMPKDEVEDYIFDEKRLRWLIHPMLLPIQSLIFWWGRVNQRMVDYLRWVGIHYIGQLVCNTLQDLRNMSNFPEHYIEAIQFNLFYRHHTFIWKPITSELIASIQWKLLSKHPQK